MRIPPAALVGALLLSGCGPDIVFQADTAIADGHWSRENKPEFSFEISDTVSAHDLYIDVRHTNDYPFSDLYLFITVKGPGLPVITDTVDCLLADATGRWHGRGLGFLYSDRFEAHVLYGPGKRFPKAGRYSIQLEQAMRTDPLEGVIDVGISVERSARKSG